MFWTIITENFTGFNAYCAIAVSLSATLSDLRRGSAPIWKH